MAGARGRVRLVAAMAALVLVFVTTTLVLLGRGDTVQPS